MRVDGIGYSPPAAMQGLAPVETGGAQAGRAFMDYLSEAVQDVSDMQARAAALQQAFARGEYENVHEVIIAAQEAGIALDLVLAIRNQVIRAYEEIMRMQI
jgi:flagellar hook-basal body complex protein FliE